VLNPFFVFESFCIILWYYDEAVWFATMVLTYNAITVMFALWETLHNNYKFRKMENYTCQMKLLRPDGSFVVVNSSELVPGDIVLVPENTVLPSDLILLKGNALMNESMLTGESIPVQKISIPYSEESYCDQKGTKYTLYGGTKVIQTKHRRGELVLGLVRNTGYYTAKGSIIREILYPTDLNFKFEAESEKFILLGVIIALFASAIVLPIMVAKGDESIKFMVVVTLDMFSYTVPPALPAALTAGTYFAIQRLKRSKVFCISPMRVNLGAQVKTFVFDKTGTLTDDTISIVGFKPVVGYETGPVFTKFESSAESLQPAADWWDMQDALRYREMTRTLLLEAAASC
jgi:magnesium-transporting ATPase (P-type)